MQEDSQITTTDSATPPQKIKRPVAAGAVSALIPGLGQLVIGNKKAAWIFFTISIVWLLLFFPPFRLPRTYPGLIFLIISAFAIPIAASWHAAASESDRFHLGSLWLRVLIVPLACVAACAWLGISFRAGGFRLFKIPSTSMEVTIQEGDELIADMRSYRGASSARGSIIILHSPKDASIFLIKRLIAVGGDTIQGSNGKIFLNEKPLNEPYIEHTGDPPDELVNFGPVTVPPHKLFVMGDNRDISLDSRSEEFGLVDESAVMGKPLYILKAGHDRAGEPLQ